MVAPGCTKRLPLSGSTRPAAIFRSVDLPEPLRPIRHTRSDCETDSSTPDNSGVPPKGSLMSFNWISGGAIVAQFNLVFPSPGRPAGAGCGGGCDRPLTQPPTARPAPGVPGPPPLHPP